MRSFPPVTAKQAMWIIAVAAALWVPIIAVIIFFGARFTQRQIAAIGLINMLVCVPILILLYRNWISKIG
jgi:hypothetical protein